jgi:hypothetical protein
MGHAASFVMNGKFREVRTNMFQVCLSKHIPST